MKRFIEVYLKRLGCTDIHWYYGREGYYVLCKHLNSTMCYNINDLVTNRLAVENMSRNFVEESE